MEEQTISFYETLSENSNGWSNGIVTFQIGNHAPVCGFYIGRFEDFGDFKSYLIRRRLIPFVGETYGVVGEKICVLTRNFTEVKKKIQQIKTQIPFHDPPSIRVSTREIDGDLYA